MTPDTNPAALPVATARAKRYDNGPNLAKKPVVRLSNGELPTFKGQASSIIRGVEAHRPGSSRPSSQQSSAAMPSAGVNQASETTQNRTDRTPIEDTRAPQNDSVYEFDRPNERSCCIIL